MSVKNTNLDVNEFSLKILMMDKRLRTNCCLLVITLPKTIMLLYCFFFFVSNAYGGRNSCVCKDTLPGWLDVCSELHFTFSSSKRDVPVFRRQKKRSFHACTYSTHAQTERHQQSSSSISAFFLQHKGCCITSPLFKSSIRRPETVQAARLLDLESEKRT